MKQAKNSSNKKVLERSDILVEVLEQAKIIPAQQTFPMFARDIKNLTHLGLYRQGQRLIFLENTALDTMRAHTEKHAKSGEVGGLLIGNFCISENFEYTWVQAALPAEQSHSMRAALEFTPDSIEAIEKIREEKYPKLRSVGWYHSHPSFGIFLSGTDLHTHRTVFKDGPFIAMVLDPIQNEYGVFDWDNENEIQPVSWWVISRK